MSWILDFVLKNEIDPYLFNLKILSNAQIAQALNGYVLNFNVSTDNEDFLSWCTTNFLDDSGANIQLLVDILNNRSGASELYSALNNFLPAGQQIDPQTIAIYFSMQCGIIKAVHPEWSPMKVYWEASREMVHLLLDGVGLIPGVGEIADLTNGVIYTIEGNATDATLSYASAVPIAGWFSAGIKFAKRGITLANGTKTTLKWVVKADNAVNFGERAQLRKVIGLAVGDARQAHHILPWARQSHPAIQKAAKAADSFHMNEALNGIALNNAVHLGSHTVYDANVFRRLNLIPANASPAEAKAELLNIIADIRSAIQNNPTTHVNNLIF